MIFQTLNIDQLILNTKQHLTPENNSETNKIQNLSQLKTYILEFLDTKKEIIISNRYECHAEYFIFKISKSNLQFIESVNSIKTEYVLNLETGSLFKNGTSTFLTTQEKFISKIQAIYKNMDTHTYEIVKN